MPSIRLHAVSMLGYFLVVCDRIAVAEDFPPASQANHAVRASLRPLAEREGRERGEPVLAHVVTADGVR